MNTVSIINGEKNYAVAEEQYMFTEEYSEVQNKNGFLIVIIASIVFGTLSIYNRCLLGDSKTAMNMFFIMLGSNLLKKIKVFSQK